MQVPKKILTLIEKYQAGTASEQEKLILDEWYCSFNDAETEIITTQEETEQQISDRIKIRLLKTIEQQGEISIAKPRRKWQMAAAAAIILMLVGAYFLVPSKSAEQQLAKTQPSKPQLKNDIVPGGNKAILTLANGAAIALDSAANGTISQQGNIEVKKLNSGLLAYTINGKQITENDEAFYNMISTPRGGQYQVTLADGTQVWLNAASSIRFPVAFKGKERKVEITGEVYFEVAKNKAMPFKVSTGLSEIEVLGTHFNVNAYEDEASMKTTLLEGSVKISALNQSKYLQPGQQAQIKNLPAGSVGRITVLNNADIEETMAWKNGRFQFQSADLKSILRQISRWYDVDIVYKGNVNLHFTGQLPRNDNASKVFEKLTLTGEVHFKIDGKKIIVSH
jgi:transmembrane sensor